MHITGYQSDNCPDGYNASAFLLTSEEGPLIATMAMKCNWTRVCGEGEPFQILIVILEFLYDFYSPILFLRKMKLPA